MAVFYWLFLGEVSPEIPVKSADFSKNLPLKILQNLTFLHWNPWNRPIFLRILTFSREHPAKSADFSANFDFFPAKIPRKSREIGQFFHEFAPENPAKFFFFCREISEALFYGPRQSKKNYANTQWSWANMYFFSNWSIKVGWIIAKKRTLSVWDWRRKPSLPTQEPIRKQNLAWSWIPPLNFNSYSNKLRTTLLVCEWWHLTCTQHAKKVVSKWAQG